MRIILSFLMLNFWLISGCTIHHEKERHIYEKVLIEETPQLSESGKEDSLDKIRKKAEKIRLKKTWTLADCYTLALLESRTLRIAGENYIQAHLLNALAWGGILPKIDFEATYLRREKALAASSGNEVFTQTKQEQAFFSLDQPIFQGFKEFYAFKYAKARQESEKHRFLDQKTEVLLQTAEAFYSVITLEKSAKILKTTLELGNERLKEIEARFEVGLARKTEVLLVKAELARDRSRLTEARLLLKTAQKRLSVLLWTSALKKLKDDSEFPPLDSLEELMEAASSYRDDLKSAEQEVLAAERQIEMARADYWPHLSLNADYYLERAGVLGNVSWEVLASALVPIFNRGLTRARHREAASQWRQATQTYEDLKADIEAQVTEFYNRLLTIKSKIESLDVEVRTAQENYELQQEEYRQGLTTNLEVLTVFNQYRDNLLQLEIEQFNLKLAYVRLQASVGLIPWKSAIAKNDPSDDGKVFS
jgi:outer membrane protein TolC